MDEVDRATGIILGVMGWVVAVTLGIFLFFACQRDPHVLDLKNKVTVTLGSDEKLNGGTPYLYWRYQWGYYYGTKVTMSFPPGYDFKAKLNEVVEELKKDAANAQTK